MDKSRKNCRRKRYMPLTVAACIMLLACIMAACGSNVGSGTSVGSAGSTATPTPVASTPTVTTVAGYGTTQGCPSDSVVSNLPKANVVVTLSGSANSNVVAHTGDVIELRAPFGKQWGGPQKSTGGLTLQSPAGFAQMTDKACVWRFDAKSAGTTKIDFTGRPICKKGSMCAMFIMDLPVTITVK
jgi:hypothetical protein